MTLHRRAAGALLAATSTVAALLSLTACGSANRRACGPVLHEALDPGSIQHVLPGAHPHYLTDPPTSGPHQPSPPVPAIPPRPLTRPVQVGLLEQGRVLVQYRGLAAADVTRLRALAGPTVVVAPAASLPTGERVVATAWLTKQSCRSLDLTALRAFAAAHHGKGPT